MLILFGGALLPSAAAFAVRGQAVVCYFVLVAGMAAASLGGSVFSVLGLCAIQQRTPAELTGKVMAFVMTIAQCTQPLGADAVRMGMGTASGLVRIGDDGGCGTGHSLPLLENLLESCLKNAFK